MNFYSFWIRYRNLLNLGREENHKNQFLKLWATWATLYFRVSPILGILLSLTVWPHSLKLLPTILLAILMGMSWHLFVCKTSFL